MSYSYKCYSDTKDIMKKYPAAVIPTGEHPVNAKCRREIYSPFSVV